MVEPSTNRGRRPSNQAKENLIPSQSEARMSQYRVAAVQAGPVLLDKAATIEKACRLIQEAASGGAVLAVFPETWVPGYPVWMMRPGARQAEGAPARPTISGVNPANRKIFSRLYHNAVDVPGPDTERLGEAAKKAGMYVAIGVHERTRSGTLFNTIVFIGKDGKLLGKHRKLVPTGSERTIWGHGDGSTLNVFDTEIGRLGGLVCWENWMPLARYTLYSMGEQIHVALWPSVNDGFLLASRAVAHEGRVFVIAAGSYHTKSMIPPDLESLNEMNLPEVLASGGSTIIDPNGNCLVGPVYDQETIVYADIDLDRIIEAKQGLDVVGHYARPEVFKLHVNRREMSPSVVFEDTENLRD